MYIYTVKQKQIEIMNATPRIENINDGQMYLVIENKNNGEGEFYKKVYRTYEDAKSYYNTL